MRKEKSDRPENRPKIKSEVILIRDSESSLTQGKYGCSCIVTGPDTAIIVVSELDCTCGGTVREMLESVAGTVCEQLAPEHGNDQVIWIERTMGTNPGEPDLFDFIRRGGAGRIYFQAVGKRTEDDFWRLLFGARPAGLRLPENFGEYAKEDDEE